MNTKNNNNLSIIDSFRNFQHGKMILNYTASIIFPLLCPVVEYKWFPDWNCTMVYSKTGIAERDAVFLTKNADGSNTVWSIITYEPPILIEFSVVNGIQTVERFSISLKETSPSTTELEWRIINTAFSKESIEQVRNLNNDMFNIFLEKRRKEMDYYLQTGKMI